MSDRVRPAVRAATAPLIGLALTYLLFVLTPWGREFDVSALHGRWSVGWKVRQADLALLEMISGVTLILALVALVLVATARGHWRTGLRLVVAVAGALASTEVLKFLLPSRRLYGGDDWHWLTFGSFPSGHSVIVASFALAVLSVSSDRWRAILIGPVLAWVAVATTATVTIGWHHPSDVIGSFFLATAWHRACTVRQPVDRRLRSLLPRLSRRELTRRWHVARPSGPALGWWAFAAVIVLGAAVEGVLTAHRYAIAPQRGLGYGPWQPPADVHALPYLTALVMLIVAAGATILGRDPAQRPPATGSTRTGHPLRVRMHEPDPAARGNHAGTGQQWTGSPGRAD